MPEHAIVHRSQPIPAQDTFEVEGIRCTGLARTLADVGEQLDRLVVRRALDDARRRRTSLQWLQATAERLHGPGRRGPGVLLDLLEEARAEHRVPDSWFERLLEMALSCPELATIARQHEILDDDGRVIARVDLALPELLLGIEAHSREHHFDDDRQRLDENRDLATAARGWDLLYLGWQATLTPGEALEKIRAVARSRRRLLGLG